jgi:hypothetical protein
MKVSRYSDSSLFNNGPRELDGTIIGKIMFTCVYTRILFFKDVLIKNHWTGKAHIYMDASWHGADLSLFKS